MKRLAVVPVLFALSASVGAEPRRIPFWPDSVPAAIQTAPRPIPRDPRDGRVPVRSPELRGPLEVYYYDHLEAVVDPYARPALLDRERGEAFAYEALNLVDGKRSVSDIRDILTGRYLPVALADVAAWLDLLARAGAVTWRKQ